MTEQETDDLIKTLDQITSKNRQSAIQKLTMAHCTDAGIIYDLRKLNTRLTRIAIAGWLLAAVLILPLIA